MGRRTTFYHKRGIKTSYQHDKLGRVTMADFNATNVSPYEHRVVTFTYDAGDRVTSMVDQVWSGLNLLFYQTLTYTYDGMDNVTSETFVNLLTPGTNATATYALDANGRRTTMTTSGTGQSGYRTVSYAYYNDDQLQSITDPNVSVVFVPDGDARRATLTVSNVVTTYVYDNASRLTSLAYAANGNSLGNLSYTYDSDSRIIATGGTLARTNLPGTIAANYANTNQLSWWSGVTVTSDNANNLTSNPTNSATYKWDSRSMMSQVSSPLTTFGYDAVGRRRTMTASSTTSTYLYDDASAIRVVTGTGGSAVKKDVLRMPGTGEVLAYSSTTGSTTTTWTSIHDQIGSTVALVDSSGAMSTQYTYEPFGRTTFGGSSNSFPFQYAGMELDSGTELYHTPARYYSPKLHRFVSEDPTGLGDPNLFTYAGNNPISRSDPTGLQEGGGRTISAQELELFLVRVYEAFRDLGELIQDLINLFAGGGSPSIPRELQHSGHTSRGMLRAGAQWDVMPSQRYVEVTEDYANSGDSLIPVVYTIKVPPDADPDFLSISPVPLEMGPVAGMAVGRAGQRALKSRAARRLEQRVIRRLAKELGITQEQYERFHKEINRLVKEEGEKNLGQLREYLQEYFK